MMQAVLRNMQMRRPSCTTSVMAGSYGSDALITFAKLIATWGVYQHCSCDIVHHASHILHLATRMTQQTTSVTHHAACIKLHTSRNTHHAPRNTHVHCTLIVPLHPRPNRMHIERKRKRRGGHVGVEATPAEEQSSVG